MFRIERDGDQWDYVIGPELTDLSPKEMDELRSIIMQAIGDIERTYQAVNFQKERQSFEDYIKTIKKRNITLASKKIVIVHGTEKELDYLETILPKMDIVLYPTNDDFNKFIPIIKYNNNELSRVLTENITNRVLIDTFIDNSGRMLFNTPEGNIRIRIEK